MQHQEVIDLASDDDSQTSSRLSPDLLSNDSDNSPPRVRFRGNNDASSHRGQRLNRQPVISLLHSPESPPSTARAGASNLTFSQPNNRQGSRSSNQEWACSVCTLLNPQNQRICLVCGSTRRDNSVQLDDDDDVIYERTTHSRQNPQNIPTSHYVGGGAFLGGMLGAADGYANGTGVGEIYESKIERFYFGPFIMTHALSI
jgi:hypothetical protein